MASSTSRSGSAIKDETLDDDGIVDNQWTNDGAEGGNRIHTSVTLTSD